MGKVGVYRGVHWVMKRLSEVFPHIPDNTYYYFITDGYGEPTGDYFATLHELKSAIDDME